METGMVAFLTNHISKYFYSSTCSCDFIHLVATYYNICKKIITLNNILEVKYITQCISMLQTSSLKPNF